MLLLHHAITPVISPKTASTPGNVFRAESLWIRRRSRTSRIARSRQSIDPCATPAEPVRASRWALHLDRLRLVPSQCLWTGERFLRAYPLSMRPRLSSSLELLRREHAALHNGVLWQFANALPCMAMHGNAWPCMAMRPFYQLL